MNEQAERRSSPICSRPTAATPGGCRSTCARASPVDGEARAIADYVAGMTDRFALAEHARLGLAVADASVRRRGGRPMRPCPGRARRPRPTPRWPRASRARWSTERLAACVNLVPGVQLDLPLAGPARGGRRGAARGEDTRRSRRSAGGAYPRAPSLRASRGAGARPVRRESRPTSTGCSAESTHERERGAAGGARAGGERAARAMPMRSGPANGDPARAAARARRRSRGARARAGCSSTSPTPVRSSPSLGRGARRGERPAAALRGRALPQGRSQGAAPRAAPTALARHRASPKPSRRRVVATLPPIEDEIEAALPRRRRSARRADRRISSSRIRPAACASSSWCSTRSAACSSSRSTPPAAARRASSCAICAAASGSPAVEAPADAVRALLAEDRRQASPASRPLPRGFSEWPGARGGAEAGRAHARRAGARGARPEPTDAKSLARAVELVRTHEVGPWPAGDARAREGRRADPGAGEEPARGVPRRAARARAAAARRRVAPRSSPSRWRRSAARVSRRARTCFWKLRPRGRRAAPASPRRRPSARARSRRIRSPTRCSRACSPRSLAVSISRRRASPSPRCS